MAPFGYDAAGAPEPTLGYAGYDAAPIGYAGAPFGYAGAWLRRRSIWLRRRFTLAPFGTFDNIN